MDLRASKDHSTMCRNKEKNGERRESAVSGIASFFRPFPLKSCLIQSFSTKLKKKAICVRNISGAEFKEKVSLLHYAPPGNEMGTL